MDARVGLLGAGVMMWQAAGSAEDEAGDHEEAALMAKTEQERRELEEMRDIEEEDADFLRDTAVCLLAMGMTADVNESKWGPRGPYTIVKSADSLPRLLEHNSARMFKSHFGMTRRTFERVAAVLATHENTASIFLSTGHKPQAPVAVQLAVFLRFNCGQSTKLDHAAFNSHVSVGSVLNYRLRVTRALLRLKGVFIRWPGESRKLEIKHGFSEHGFANAIGAVDGTLVRLQNRPLDKEFPLSWYTKRKTMYGFNIQIVSDHERNIISYLIGYPARTTDITIWKASELWLNRGKYFHDGEYLLADKGYQQTSVTMRPFCETKCTVGNQDWQKRKLFNKYQKAGRVTVEHAIGGWKRRFASLSNFPGFGLAGQLKEVEALLIIHQMVRQLGTREDEMEGDDDEEEDDDDPDEGGGGGVEGEGVNGGAYQMGIIARAQLAQALWAGRA